jgi:deoxyadenosine/deoxycytidine kinase
MIFANLRTIREDMSNFQFSSYLNTNLELAKMIPFDEQVDYFILIKAPFEVVLERIKTRGRENEQEVDVEY